MKITIKDVAIEAAVTISTVSGVLNNKKNISEETKIKVLHAIKKLNYSPNAVARSLVKKKRHLLGVVIPNEAKDFLSHHFFIEAMKGMSEYAQNKNYYMTYAFSKDENSEEKYIEDLCSSSIVDGICLLRAKENDKTIEFLRKRNFPFVVIGRPEQVDDFLWVDNDNFKISYDICEKIIKKGIKNIAFLGARPQWNLTKDRFKGFKMACEVHGILVDNALVVNGEDFSEKIGYDLCANLLENNARIKAIFTTDDLLAIGVLRKLKEMNIKNIIVTGFNNIPLAPYQDPPLASIDIKARELGYTASKLLINSLEGVKNLNNHSIINCEFIERESF